MLLGAGMEERTGRTSCPAREALHVVSVQSV